MNQVALITGGSRGIGRGIALELAATGFNLALNFHTNLDAAQAAANECKATAAASGKTIQVELFRGNVADRSDREHLIQGVEEKFSRLDLLVNNAGIAPKRRLDILETSEESFDELLDTNLKGPFFLTQLAAQWMIRQKAADPAFQGKIVTISSVSAYTASVNRGEYCISKAGLSMMVQLFAARLAGHGINVYEIRPGIIETDMTSGVKEKYDKLIAEGITPIRRWGSPADVGKAVAAIAQSFFPFSTGEVFNVDGGYHFRVL